MLMLLFLFLLLIIKVKITLVENVKASNGIAQKGEGERRIKESVNSLKVKLWLFGGCMAVSGERVVFG